MNLKYLTTAALSAADTLSELDGLLTKVYQLLDTLKDEPHNSHHADAIESLLMRLGEY
jgi:hypothetical protein